MEEKLNAYRSQLLAKLKEEASAVALQHKDEQCVALGQCPWPAVGLFVTAACTGDEI